MSSLVLGEEFFKTMQKEDDSVKTAEEKGKKNM